MSVAGLYSSEGLNDCRPQSVVNVYATETWAATNADAALDQSYMQHMIY